MNRPSSTIDSLAELIVTTQPMMDVQPLTGPGRQVFTMEPNLTFDRRRTALENIKIKKDKLLEILKENRSKHRAIFEEALEGYKKKAEEVLSARLRQLKAGERVRMTFSIPEPADQTKDYNRVIRMLELMEGDAIELSEQDFAMYVMDEWSWKRNFLHSNSAYSHTAVMALQDAGETE